MVQRGLIMNDADLPTVQEINNSILSDVQFLAHLAQQNDVDMHELKIIMDKLSILIMGIAYE